MLHGMLNAAWGNVSFMDGCRVFARARLGRVVWYSAKYPTRLRAASRGTLNELLF
jgi:hypothetical protein